MVQRSQVRRSPQAGTEGVVAPEGPLVTAGFHPLADFATFGPNEVEMLHEAGTDLEVFTKAIAESVCDYLAARLPRLGISGASVDQDIVEEWLSRSSIGPFNGDFAGYLRGVTHVGGGTTFPGVSVSLPPQMVIGLVAWLQGEILIHLGDVSDTITLSGVGGIWMDQLMLQLGVMLEPVLGSRSAPQDDGGRHNTEVHPYADLAGFGMAEGRLLSETGALLEPAGNGVISLAYSYLLSRPESAGYFPDVDPYWINDNFGEYLRKVVSAHVWGGEDPQREIPPQLTIALIGWMQMRVMTALNTVAFDAAGAAAFGELGDPGLLADVGTAWMKMLTLQLGTLIDPYLKDSAA
ncbi:MAG TPA: hypothetical protein VGK51_12565 [Actinomycetota bacterium]